MPQAPSSRASRDVARSPKRPPDNVVFSSDGESDMAGQNRFLPEGELPRARDPVRALLIDDDNADISIMRLLSARSKQMDFFLKSCKSTPDARDALAASRFDILYVDYWLGEETSISFIHDVTQEYDVPCILVTGLDTPDIRRLAFRAGVAGFLAKDELSIQAIEAVTLTVLRPRGRMD